MKVTDTHVYFYSTREIFSNWYPARFEMPLIWGGKHATEFHNSEQAFMAFKALHFADFKVLDAMLDTPDPREVKALGRRVGAVRGNFNEEEWNKAAPAYMAQANLPKYLQNVSLRHALLNTKKRKLVEASGSDRIWGVGLREEDPLILDEANWRGTNKLGDVLGYVREACERWEEGLFDPPLIGVPLDGAAAKPDA